MHPVLTAKAATRRGARLCALCPPKAPLSIVPHAVRQHIDNSPDLGYYVGCWQAGVSSSARSAVCSPSGTLIDQGTCNKGWRKGGVRVSDFRDRTIRCEDCRNTFVFTAGEQAFYQERGFSEPKRCPSCRAARKAAAVSVVKKGSDLRVTSNGKLKVVDVITQTYPGFPTDLQAQMMALMTV
ncbi:MAG: zinc-ribbon domain containing protein, partial [Anaerolineae bacterium]